MCAPCGRDGNLATRGGALSRAGESTPGWLRKPRMDAGGGALAARTVPRSARAIRP